MSDLHSRRVQTLIRALQLRSMLKLIREPDRVVDYLLAQHLELLPLKYTGDLDLATKWARLLVPDLCWTFIEVGHLHGIRPCHGGRDIPIWLVSRYPSILVCFSALCCQIDFLIESKIVVDSLLLKS